MLAASHRAAERQDWVLAGRLAAAAAADGKEHSAALTLADALNHQGRHEEALAALGDWRGDGDNEMARVAVLRAYILYWGLGRTDDADRTLAVAEGRRSPIPSSRAWVAAIRAGMLTFRGRPAAAAAHIRPILEQDDLSPRAAGRRAGPPSRSAWPGRAARRRPSRWPSPVSNRACSTPTTRPCRCAGTSWPDCPPTAWPASSRRWKTWPTAEYEHALQLRNPQAQGVTAGALGWVCSGPGAARQRHPALPGVGGGTREGRLDGGPQPEPDRA